MTLACSRGCIRLRRHKSDCPDPDDCRGCEARLAEYGALCWPCHRRLELMLTDAPTVYAWLTANLAAGQGAAPMNTFVTGKSLDGSPAPIKVAIFDQRQILGDRLASWVDLLCEEHRLSGPDRHTPGADAGYLWTWVDRIEKAVWVVDFWEELAETMSLAHALAPWRPEVVKQAATPCPECSEYSLVVYGGEDDVVCLGCRSMMTPAQFRMWRRILAVEAAKRETISA